MERVLYVGGGASVEGLACERGGGLVWHWGVTLVLAFSVVELALPCGGGEQVAHLWR